MSTRPRRKIVTLSDAAALRVLEVMSSSSKPYLRVGVKNGGCAGMEYVMDYADEPAPFDEVIEEKGVRILVKVDAIMFLLGSEIDYETDACGCGESVTIVAAREEA